MQNNIFILGKQTGKIWKLGKRKVNAEQMHFHKITTKLIFMC